MADLDYIRTHWRGQCNNPARFSPTTPTPQPCLRRNRNASLRLALCLPLAAIACALAIGFYTGDVLATPDNMVQELRGMAEASTNINKTACYIIGTISAVVGIAMAVYKQSFMTFAASTGITYAAFKGPSLITAAMLI